MTPPAIGSSSLRAPDIWAVARQLGVAPDRRGEIHADCPACGKPAKRGQTHFHVTERGAHCFVCGYSASHGGLLRRLGGDLPGLRTRQIAPPLPPKPAPPPSPRAWQAEPERWVRRLASAADLVPRWQAYRPFSDSTIDRWQLGVGRLPSTKCAHRRLVVPIRRDGAVVALAGRAFECPPSCEAAKWTLSGGSEFALFNLDGVGAGATVIVVENRADAILAGQEWPGYVTVAKGSANVWRPEWTARLLSVAPAFVLFWPDNDAAGYAGAARGANELLEAGLCARVRRWSEAAPAKADLGQFLMALREARCAA